MFGLQGRVAIVTGGNGGIGLGIARGMAEAGARIVIAARNASKSRAAVDELSTMGAEAVAIEVDVTSETAVASMTEDVMRRWGRLDVVVNNAGTNIRTPPHQVTLEQWRTVMDTNLTGAFLCARAAYPHMKTTGGKIINIGSLLSTFGAAFAPAYGASKGGLVQLTKSLAVAWAADNIQVNAILPGWIDTDLSRGARREILGLEQSAVARTPMGRWGRPDDLAGIAVFLSSAASDFITGTAIPVDGGYSIAL